MILLMLMLTKLKLWKVDISLEEPNEKLKLVNEKIYVNIKDELEGVELKPLSNTFPPSQPTNTYISSYSVLLKRKRYIVPQRIVVTSQKNSCGQ